MNHKEDSNNTVLDKKKHWSRCSFQKIHRLIVMACNHGHGTSREEMVVLFPPRAENHVATQEVTKHNGDAYQQTSVTPAFVSPYIMVQQSQQMTSIKFPQSLVLHCRDTKGNFLKRNYLAKGCQLPTVPL